MESIANQNLKYMLNAYVCSSRASKGLKRVFSGTTGTRQRAHHSDDGLVLVGGQAQPAGNTPDGGVGGGHIGVGPKVKVQHGGIGTLDQNALAILVGLVDQRHTVRDERSHLEVDRNKNT